MKTVFSFSLLLLLFTGCALPVENTQQKQTQPTQTAATAISNPTLLKRWIASGNIDKKDANGFNVLLYALTSSAPLETVRYIVEQGADIHVRAPLGLTALHWAVIRGKPEVVNYLLSLGLKVETPDDKGKNALVWADDTLQNYRFNPNGTPKQSLLGIQISNINEAWVQFYKRRTGVVVQTIRADALSAKAVLKPWDLIVAADGYPINNIIELTNYIGNKAPQSSVTLTVIRPNIRRGALTVKVQVMDAAIVAQDAEKIKERLLPLDPLAKVFKPVKKTDTVSAYEQFVASYPDSYFAREAKASIAQIKRALAQKEIIDTITDLMKKKDIDGLIAYVDSTPEIHAVAVSIPTIDLLFTGPRELLVIKVLQHIKQGLGAEILSSKIRSIKKPYKNFTLEEIGLLKKQGLSEKVLAAMLDATSAYEDRIQRQKEQQAMIDKQEAIAKGMQASQKEALDKMQAQQQQVQMQQQQQQSNGIGDAVKDALIKKGTEKLIGDLFDNLF